ncbi:hypothetical protein FHG87_011821 [Trinorchestia longiramus]|nr:hypothetical protein FHG87_011821 [Trinorchestia longiramus]
MICSHKLVKTVAGVEVKSHYVCGDVSDVTVQHTDAEVPRPSAQSRHSSLTPSSSTSFHPSSTSVLLNVSNKSTDNVSGLVGGSSLVHQEQAYKNTAPQIIVNNGMRPKNVNSALTKQREASPSRWQVNTSNVTHNETPRGSSPLVDDQSRLLKFISEEAAENANRNGTPTMDPKKLYGGAKIPSRVFKHLQTEFSDASVSAKPPIKTRENSSPIGADKPQLSAGLLRLLQSDQNQLRQDKSDGDGSCVSSSYGEMDEYYNNGMANTAARKESVLRELTTQFDPFTECRKPKAAPGKVFRYLQQQYGSPDDEKTSRPFNNERNGRISHANSFSSETDDQPKSSRFHSPSFSVLQNQYKNDEASSNGLKLVTRRVSLEKPGSSNGSDPHDLTSLRITEEGDPVHSKPYLCHALLILLHISISAIRSSQSQFPFDPHPNSPFQPAGRSRVSLLSCFTICGRSRRERPVKPNWQPSRTV